MERTCHRAKGSATLDNRSLAIHVLAMANREHQNQQDSLMNLIDGTIIAHAHPPGIGDTGHLLASCWKRIIPQRLDFGRQSLLCVSGQLFQLTEGQRFELNGVGHDNRLSHNFSFFLTVSQGMVRESFKASRTLARSISSSSFSRSSRSSIGTTAATGFLPRCTMTRSPRYSARLKMSEKFWRAVLAVSLFGIFVR